MEKGGSRGFGLPTHIRGLQQWFSATADTPFTSVKVYQHRATSLVRSNPGPRRLIFKASAEPPTILLPDGELSLLSVSQWVIAAQNHAKALLSEELLFGNTFSMDIASLKDDWTNEKPGYSVFSDAGNQVHLGSRDALARHIYATPTLREKFILCSTGTNLVWNVAHLREWLALYAKLDLLCLMLANVTGGAPGRITEIVSMPSANTSYGMRRSLLILHGHVLLTRTYHKQRHADGQDRFIPHCLDSLLSTVFIYKEALCRPFAQLCAREIWPRSEEAKARYASYLFNNLPSGRPPCSFGSSEVTLEMRKWTKKHTGVSLGVQLWRHCSTAFRRRLHCIQEDVIKGRDTAESAQAGHSHTVDAMHYGRSKHSIFDLSEDRIYAFLSLSKKWHENLGLEAGEYIYSRPWNQVCADAFK